MGTITHMKKVPRLTKEFGPGWDHQVEQYWNELGNHTPGTTQEGTTGGCPLRQLCARVLQGRPDTWRDNLVYMIHQLDGKTDEVVELTLTLYSDHPLDYDTNVGDSLPRTARLKALRAQGPGKRELMSVKVVQRAQINEALEMAELLQNKPRPPKEKALNKVKSYLRALLGSGHDTGGTA